MFETEDIIILNDHNENLLRNHSPWAFMAGRGSCKEIHYEYGGRAVKAEDRGTFKRYRNKEITTQLHTLVH